MEIELKGFYLSVKGYPFALVTVNKELFKFFFSYRGLYNPIEGEASKIFTQDVLEDIEKVIKDSEEAYAKMVFSNTKQEEYGKKIALWDKYYNFINRKNKNNVRVSKYKYSKLFK